MSEAPQDRWLQVERQKRIARRSWLRSLTVEDKWRLYIEMYHLVQGTDRPDMHERLVAHRRQEKIACRLRMREAFSVLEQP
jgi:hypothetical protein